MLFFYLFTSELFTVSVTTLLKSSVVYLFSLVFFLFCNRTPLKHVWLSITTNYKVRFRSNKLVSNLTYTCNYRNRQLKYQFSVISLSSTLSAEDIHNPINQPVIVACQLVRDRAALNSEFTFIKLSGRVIFRPGGPFVLPLSRRGVCVTY